MTNQPARKKRLWPKVLIGLGVAVVVVVAMLPTIAGWVAPGIVEGQAGKLVKGTVKAGGASFGWTGPQRVGPLVWKDEQGQEFARVSISTSAGLLGLATGGLDLGEVVVSDASVRLVRGKDGRLNIEDLLVEKPAAKGTSTPPRETPAKAITLPKGLKVRLKAQNVSATFVDETGASGVTTVELRDVRASADVDPKKPLSVRLDAMATGGGQAAGRAGGAGAAQGEGGTISVAIDATDWAKPNGEVTLDAARVTAKVGVDGLPTALVDALVGPIARDASGATVPLSSALGATVRFSTEASGSMQSAVATIELDAGRVTATGALAIKDQVLTTTKPLTLRVQADSIGALVPTLRAPPGDPGQAAKARITRLPDASVTIDKLSVRLPAKPGELDLRGMAGELVLALTDVEGEVALVEGRGASAMAIAPLRATLATTDLSGSVRVELGTRATLGGSPAGDVMIDATLAGLLDERGKPRSGLPGSVDATIAVREIATGVLQPFVQAMGLDLSRDIGPTLDVLATAKTDGAGGGDGRTGGAQAPINLDLRATSRDVTASAHLTLSDAALVTRGEGVGVEARTLGNLLAALTRPREATSEGGSSDTRAKASQTIAIGAAPGSSGTLTLKVRGLSIPLTAERRPKLHEGEAFVTWSALGLSATITPAGQAALAPVLLERCNGSLTLAKGGVKGGFEAIMNHAGTPAYAAAQADVPGLLVAEKDGAWRVAAPMALRPASLEATVALPTALARAGGLDQKTAAMLEGALGRVIDVRLQGQPAPGDAMALTTKLTTDRLKGEVRASVSPGLLALAPTTMVLDVTPASFDAIMESLRGADGEGNGGAGGGASPKLVGPTRAEVAIGAISIPLDKESKPELERAGTLAATITIPTEAVLDGVKVGAGSGRVGVRGLELQVEAPLAGLIPDGKRVEGGEQAKAGSKGELKANLKGGLVGPRGAEMGRVSVVASTGLGGGKPVGTMRANVKLEGLATAQVDDLLGKAGFVSGALGESASVTLSATGDPAMSNASAEVSISAPNVTTTGPLKARLTPDRVELVEPARFTVRAQPSFVNGLLAPAGGSGGAPLTLAEATTIDLDLSRLVLPRAQEGKASPAPDAQVALTIPSARWLTSDKQTLAMGATSLTLASEAGPAGDGARGADRPLAFSLTIDGVATGQAPSQGNVSLTGRVSNLVNAEGGFDMANAIADAQGRMPSMPTSLIDTLTKRDGLLIDALGPTIDCTLDVDRFPISGKPVAGVAPGRVDLKATSQRASVTLLGDVGEGVLSCPQPVTLSLTEITSGLSGRIVKGLPLLGTFEKGGQDAPAMITATGLTLPLSGDLSKLNGVVQIDPGEARFATSSGFGQLLKFAKLGSGGGATIGKRLEPLTITVANGVASYPRWRIPLGEFTLETEGRVDLAARRVDVVTWVPFGALADGAAGKFNTGLGSLLGRAAPVLEAASMMPFRTSGSFDKPETGPDLKLFAETTVQKLAPDKLIKEGLRDLLGGLGGKREEKKEGDK
jgi:hypothetical protein